MNALGGDHRKAVFSLPRLDFPLEQQAAHLRRGGLLPGHRYCLHCNSSLLGQAQQLLGGGASFFKGHGGASRCVAGKAHHHRGILPDKIFQNRQMLPGKVREAVHIQPVRLPEVAGFQLLQHPGHKIPGVHLSPLADGIVGLQNQGQLLQLLGKASLGLGGGCHQVRRGDTAAFEHIHSVQQSLQELRLGLHRCIGFQLAVQLPHRRGHGNDSASFVQGGGDMGAQVLRRTSGQSGEGQHLCIPAGGVSRCHTKPALHLMADKLRHQEDGSGSFPGHILPHHLQNLPGIGYPVRAQHQCQHTITSIFLSDGCIIAYFLSK